MRALAEKLTGYIIAKGAAEKKYFEFYSYGFQIALEMGSCLLTCAVISFFMNMFIEFLVMTVVFVSLRSFAGGIHLNSYRACFTCSVAIQCIILIFNKYYSFNPTISAIIIVLCSLAIGLLSPVQSENAPLDHEQICHCKKVVIGIFVLIDIFTVVCLILGQVFYTYISIVATTLLSIFLLQLLGLIKTKRLL